MGGDYNGPEVGVKLVEQQPITEPLVFDRPKRHLTVGQRPDIEHQVVVDGHGNAAQRARLATPEPYEGRPADSPSVVAQDSHIKSLSDGADAERATLEARHARRLTRVLRSILRELLPQDVSPDIAAHAVSRLQQYRKPLHDALYAMLLEGARLGTDHGRHAVEVLQGTKKRMPTESADTRTSADTGDPISTKADDSTAALTNDWDLVNEDARLWASQYAGQLVDGITATSTTLLQGALSDYIAGTITYRDLIAHLAPTFGSRRAETIATTEITRAFAEGSRAAWQRTGVIQWWSWQTANDERTCPVCQPRQGVICAMDAEMPPAHVRCRCWTSPSVDGPDGTP